MFGSLRSSSTAKMSRLFKRKLFGSVALILIICNVLYFFVYSLSFVLDRVAKENEFLNLNDFRYKIQPTDLICNSSSEELDVLIVIPSSADHKAIRSSHRAGISNANLRKMKMVRVFLFGSDITLSKPYTDQIIHTEHEQFNDVVQGNFVDSYYNLTYKNAMGLLWASSHPCLKTKFIIKMDDDSIVDFFHLTHYLLTNHYGRLQANKTEHFLAGFNFYTGPIRNDKSKWFVSRGEYAANFYPVYLSGFLWITTPYTARTLIEAFDRSKQIFRIDDVWITGMLRKIAHIPLSKTLEKWIASDNRLIECCVDDMKKFKFRCPFLAAFNNQKRLLIEQFLQALHKQCYNMSSDIMIDHCIERDPKLSSLEMTCMPKGLVLSKRAQSSAPQFTYD